MTSYIFPSLLAPLASFFPGFRTQTSQFPRTLMLLIVIITKWNLCNADGEGLLKTDGCTFHPMRIQSVEEIQVPPDSKSHSKLIMDVPTMMLHILLMWKLKSISYSDCGIYLEYLDRLRQIFLLLYFNFNVEAWTNAPFSLLFFFNTDAWTSHASLIEYVKEKCGLASWICPLLWVLS